MASSNEYDFERLAVRNMNKANRGKLLAVRNTEILAVICKHWSPAAVINMTGLPI